MITQQPQPLGDIKRLRYAELMLKKLQNFSSKIIFNIEAHFRLYGYVNKHNWGPEKPQQDGEPAHTNKQFIANKIQRLDNFT